MVRRRLERLVSRKDMYDIITVGLGEAREGKRVRRWVCEGMGMIGLRFDGGTRTGEGMRRFALICTVVLRLSSSISHPFFWEHNLHCDTPMHHNSFLHSSPSPILSS